MVQDGDYIFAMPSCFDCLLKYISHIIQSVGSHRCFVFLVIPRSALVMKLMSQEDPIIIEKGSNYHGKLEMLKILAV